MIPVPPAGAGLPDLGVLFDGDAMADVLRRSLPDCVSGAFTVDACRPVYIRYKPGTSCLVQHEITLRDLDSGAVLESIAHTRQYADDRAAHEFQRGRLRRLI